MFNTLYILLLKYFVIIKKEEIVASKIDFDDHKPSEEITKKIFIFEDYFYDVSDSPRD